MSLNPPAEIVGPMSRHTPLEVRNLRRDWVRQKDREGHTRRKIAAALGVSTSALCSIRRDVFGAQPRDWLSRPKKPKSSCLSPWGRSCGWQDFTPEQRGLLYRLGEKWGCTPSEAIAELARDALEELSHKEGGA